MPPTLPFTRFELDNGLVVILHESPGRTGFAHLFEHLMLMGRGRAPRGGRGTLPRVGREGHAPLAEPESKRTVEIPVAWGEMDAYGHVNNAVYLRWLETARIAWFEACDFPEASGRSGPVLRTATVTYDRAVKYPDTVTVTVRPTRVGRTSVTLAYEVFSAVERGRVATGETVVVLADFERGTALELPGELRARLQAESDAVAAGG